MSEIPLMLTGHLILVSQAAVPSNAQKQTHVVLRQHAGLHTQ